MSEYDVNIGCDLLLVAIREICSALDKMHVNQCTIAVCAPREERVMEVKDLHNLPQQKGILYEYLWNWCLAFQTTKVLVLLLREHW